MFFHKFSTEIDSIRQLDEVQVRVVQLAVLRYELFVLHAIANRYRMGKTRGFIIFQ